MSFDGLIVENENTKSGYNDGNDLTDLFKQNGTDMSVINSLLGDTNNPGMNESPKILDSSFENSNPQDGPNYEDFDFMGSIHKEFGNNINEMDDMEDVSDDNLPEEEQAVNYTGDKDDEDFGKLLAKEMGEEAAGQVLSGVGFSIPSGLVPPSEPSKNVSSTTEELQNEAQIRESIVKTFFPTFERGVLLNFSELFKPKPVKLAPPKKKTPKVCVPGRLTLEVDTDYAIIFNSKKSLPLKRNVVSPISTHTKKRRRTANTSQVWFDLE